MEQDKNLPTKRGELGSKGSSDPAEAERNFEDPLILTDYRGEEREEALRDCFVERVRILPDQLPAINILKPQGAAEQRDLLHTLDQLIRLRYSVFEELVPWSGAAILYKLDTFPPQAEKWKAIEHQSEPDAGAMVVFDLRSAEEKKIERDSLSGNVTVEVESVVDELLAIQAKTFLVSWSLHEGAKCVCNGIWRSVYKLVFSNGRLVCEHCGRSAALADYDEEKRHKAVVEIGRRLHEAGKLQLMQSVAGRFKARGGDLSSLNLAWDQVGYWRP